MKSNKFIIAALVALVPAAAALAQGTLADAVRNGEIVTGEMGVPMAAAPMLTSTTSRAQVQRQAYADPTTGHGDIGMAGASTQFVSTRTRAEVRAEAIEAARHGGTDVGEAGPSPVHYASPSNAYAGSNVEAGQGFYRY